MPKVQEYLPELDAQGPVGQTSPMLEEATQYGRGISEFGRSASDAFSIIHQRQTAMENSDAYASVAEQRSNMMIKIQQQTNDGTLDVNKIKDEQQQWIEGQADQYSTAGGKDTFNRAAARMQGAILQHAAMGQTAVAGAKAKEDLTTLVNKDSNVLLSDPTQFGDLRDSHTEFMHHQLEAGVWTPAMAQQFQKASDEELSKSAVRGFMQTDYNNIKQSVINTGGKVDPNILQLNAARQMLDGGHFDEYMNSDTKQKMMGEIKANQAAAQSAGIQALGQQKMALDAKSEAWKTDAYLGLRDGTFTPDKAIQAQRDNLLTASEMNNFLHLSDQSAKQEIKSNPMIKNQMIERILSPDNAPGHVSYPSQYDLMVGQGLTLNDHSQLSNMIQLAKDPNIRANMAAVIQEAKQKIGNAPDAQYRAGLFNTDMIQAIQKAQQNKEPISDLFDKSNKNYVGNFAQKYYQTPAQNLAAQAEQVRGTAVAPQTSQTFPGVQPTQGNAKGPNPNDIQGMNLQALKNLNPKNLSVEQREAARLRYNQLSKGK